MARNMLNNDTGALDEERVALRIRVAVGEEQAGHYAELLEARDRLREVSAQLMRIHKGDCSVTV